MSNRRRQAAKRKRERQAELREQLGLGPDEDPRSVLRAINSFRCPTCGAAPGSYCRDGKTATHKRRINKVPQNGKPTGKATGLRGERSAGPGRQRGWADRGAGRLAARGGWSFIPEQEPPEGESCWDPDHPIRPLFLPRETGRNQPVTFCTAASSSSTLKAPSMRVLTRPSESRTKSQGSVGRP